MTRQTAGPAGDDSLIKCEARSNVRVTAPPPARVRSALVEDGFHLQELVHAELPELSTVPRLLVASEGSVLVERGAIDVNHSRP